MKSVAADQIKRACKNYLGGEVGRGPPHATEVEKFEKIKSW